MLGTHVPEAPVDEYGDPRGTEDYVGRGLDIGHGPRLDPVAKPHPVKFATKPELGHGIPATLAGHLVTDSRRAGLWRSGRQVFHSYRNP